jgi:hypothetical protein
MSDDSESTRLLDVLRAIGRLLDDRAQPWALVGGLAVSVRVEPRFTRDIDIAVGVAGTNRGKPLSDTIRTWLDADR